MSASFLPVGPLSYSCLPVLDALGPELRCRDGGLCRLRLLRELRDAGFSADMEFSSRSPKAQFKIADREKAPYCLITGDNELKDNTVVVKTLATGEQIAVSRSALATHLTQLVG